MSRSFRDRLRAVSSRARRRLESRGIILLYHRIAEPKEDPWQLSVSPAHFAEHLQVLRRHGRPILVRELIHALSEGRIPKRFVLVTFDDGYEDNLRQAKPLLERNDVPATVFLAGGCLGQDRPFWWDEIEGLLLRPDRRPAALRLEVSGQPRDFLLEGDEPPDEERGRARPWRAWSDAPPTQRHRAYLAIHDLLSSLDEVERRRALEDLRAQTGPLSHPGDAGLPLSPEQAVELARGGLIEIGAHTLTHPRLARLPANAQREEIAGSRTLLERILAAPVTSFAYPFGGPADYTPQTASLVREAGFSGACSSAAGTVGRLADVWALPRLHVEDCDGEQFDRRLSRRLAA